MISMPETKIKIKDTGTIHLMALDTSSEFLPFGSPIADYLRGVAGNQNGSRALLKQVAVDFSPAVRWTASIASMLRTTGFSELERDGTAAPTQAPAREAEPGIADFLPLREPGLASREPDAVKISPAVEPQALSIALPRVSASPLRQRMTFGPPPAAKVKPAPVVVSKTAPPTPVAKTGPVVAPPPKPVQATPVKPAAPAPVQKAAAPIPVQTKPVTVIPPAPKPGVTPAPPQRVSVIQPPPTASPKINAPAARAAETSPVAAVVKAAPAPTQVSKAPVPIISPKPPAEPTPSSEPIPAARPRATGSLSITAPAAPPETVPARSIEPNLAMSASDSRSFLDKVPVPARIGIALVLAIITIYFVFGKDDKPANLPVAVGEQGWSTEWAADAVGSRKGRQITLYRPSNRMSDYQFQFVGQIESKALGWVFREFDTKNYYAMKIETLRPGVMALTHFAVVDGRESSFNQKPLTVDARAGVAYKVKLEATGPRFTVYVQGEPVDFWTDTRLKTGAVGFMNERDERGASSSVQFSFPRGVK